jgi:CheY-like chemotaxis protein
MTALQLNGLRVFVVEDEFAVLLLIEDMLEQLGCTIAGSASRIASALEGVAQCTADIALLDVHIAGEAVYPVAEALTARNVPIVFSTGYDGGAISEPWRRRPVLQKPYNAGQLAAALRAGLAGK